MVECDFGGFETLALSEGDEADWEQDVPFEPAGSEQVTTGNVTKYAAF